MKMVSLEKKKEYAFRDLGPDFNELLSLMARFHTPLLSIKEAFNFQSCFHGPSGSKGHIIFSALDYSTRITFCSHRTELNTICSKIEYKHALKNQEYIVERFSTLDFI